MNRILLVEDDFGITQSLTHFLRSEGFEVQSAPGQSEALALLSEQRFNLALLDLRLADGNGFSLCTEIKQCWKLPVIFLTASGDEYNTVTGLDIGADDYIVKPFRPRELCSRIRSVLRRYGGGNTVFHFEDVTVDTDKGSVSRNGQEIVLSALEYKILLLFLSNRGRLLTRNRLLEEIWDLSGDFVNDNTLTVYIKRIREKIEQDPQNPQIIKTIRGLGYRMD